MKKLIILMALVLPMFSQAKQKEIAYKCADIKTQKEVFLVIVGNGSYIEFYGGQNRRSNTPDAKLDGRPAYEYEGSNYSGITLPEELMKGQSARGRIYQTGYDESAWYDCVIFNN